MAGDDRRHHEPVAAEAADDVEAGDARQLADDRVAVGADGRRAPPTGARPSRGRAAASASTSARAIVVDEGEPRAEADLPVGVLLGIEMPPTSSPRSDCET